MISVSFFQLVSFSAHSDWLYRFLHFLCLRKAVCIKKRTTFCTVICTLICIILCSIGPLYQFMYFVFICAVSLFAPHISFFDTTHYTVFRATCIIFRYNLLYRFLHYLCHYSILLPVPFFAPLVSYFNTTLVPFFAPHVSFFASQAASLSPVFIFGQGKGPQCSCCGPPSEKKNVDGFYYFHT